MFNAKTFINDIFMTMPLVIHLELNEEYKLVPLITVTIN